jgi:lysyl-tRNA synthetase class II
MRSLIALVAFAHLTAWADEPKAPDFKLTAEAFAKEAKEARADEKAFLAKYKGKTVEISGTVSRTTIPDRVLMFTGYKEKGAIGLGERAAALVPEKLDAQLRALSIGQQVTVRGTFTRTSVIAALDNCEIVKTGPSTALPTTVAALEAECKKNRDAAEKKYGNKSVVVRVKVVEAKLDSSKVLWTVSDATAAKGAPQVPAWADPLLDKKFQEQLQQVKAGDVVIVMGQARPLFGSFDLWDCVVLKEPPPGVKLPGAKK